MITLTRSQVRRLRVAFRRAALGIAHRGIVSELVLRAEGGQLRAQHRYCDLAVECVETGDHRPAATIAIPLDALADFEGPADTPVVIEAVAPDRTVVRWEDRGIPQSREYSLITPVDRLEPMPASPATWASNPAGLLDALAEAAETSTPDSTRYALECIQLQGHRGQVVATDGRQLLVRSGYSLPWTEDLLIKARPIFACRALPRDRPVEVGRTDTHVFVRVGPWTISCAIQTDLRFPAVDRVIPAAGEIGDPAAAGPRRRAVPRIGAGSPARRPRDQQPGHDGPEWQGGRARGRVGPARPHHRAGPLPVGLQRLAALPPGQPEPAGAGAAAGLHRAGLHGPRHGRSCAGTRPGSTPSSRWAAARRPGRTSR